MEEYGKAVHISYEGFKQALKDTCMTKEEFKDYSATLCTVVAQKHLVPIANEIDAMQKTLEDVNPYAIAGCGLNVVIHLELVGEDICTVVLGDFKTSLDKIMKAANKVNPDIIKGGNDD